MNRHLIGLLLLGSGIGAAAMLPHAQAETENDGAAVLQRLSAQALAGSVFSDPNTEALTESSEVGEAAARDLVWHESDDRCLQTGVYETGVNRYTINDPYPHDELMMFISGGVTLTPKGGEPVVIVAGDTVMLPKGWTGLWDSQGYRKVYVIYDCPED